MNLVVLIDGRAGRYRYVLGAFALFEDGFSPQKYSLKPNRVQGWDSALVLRENIVCIQEHAFQGSGVSNSMLRTLVSAAVIIGQHFVLQYSRPQYQQYGEEWSKATGNRLR